MRDSIHRSVLRWWGGEVHGPGWGALSLVSLPLELGFRAAIALRAGGYRSGVLATRSPMIPVVSVGNLSVGGTGKTPMAAHLLEMLRGIGMRPALVARGYGADEVLLHQRWNPDVPVLADPDRTEAVRRAAALGADVVVLDDGFQHRRLRRDMDLVLVSVEQGLPGRLLPRGPFREPHSALHRADRVIVTRKTATEAEALGLVAEIRRLYPGLPVDRCRLRAARWTDLTGRQVDPPIGPVFAVCSIANPRSFEGVLKEALGEVPPMMAFPDHHEFSAADVGAITARQPEGFVLVVTEKDAVKLQTFGKSLPGARALALDVVFEPEEEALRQALLEKLG